MISVLEELYYGNISPGDRVLAHTEKANAFRRIGTHRKSKRLSETAAHSDTA